MIYLLSCIVEHNLIKLDETFYYFSKEEVKKGSRVYVSFNKQKLIGFVVNVELVDKEAFEKVHDFKMKEIDGIIDKEPILTDELLNLGKELNKYYLYPLIGIYNTFLPPSLKPISSFIKQAKIAYEEYYFLKNKDYVSSSVYEKKILDKFNSLARINKSKLNKSKTLEKLIDLGVIELKKEEKYRYKIDKIFNYHDSFKLNEEQEKVYQEIVNSKESIFLLKGVTGSGKTELYIKLIENALKRGLNSLVLVPEISLTFLMISRIKSFFKEEVAVLHSFLTPGERYDEYRKIKDKKVRIVVGTRSAIFAPLENIGYIIIDEENDESYVQSDNFCYDTKVVAKLRNNFNNSKIILGSATPSVDSMYRAVNGEYKLLNITKKYHDTNLAVKIVDLKKQKELFSYKSHIFSLPLIEEINKALKENKQIILLINKRGYSYSVRCLNDNYVFRCPNCDLALHYHKKEGLLKCHHCGYENKFPTKCPRCGKDNNYFFNGFGIEKVVEDFKKIFPKVNYLTLNSDDTSSMNDIEDTLIRFNNKEINVLIGTQIVSKGHDFNDVGLVGIIDADTLMYLPSYKAKEACYDIICQTLGRAGRFENAKGVVQTSFPKSLLINRAIQNDYNSFYLDEIRDRKNKNQPPFINLISFKFESNKEEILKKYTEEFKLVLEEKLEDIDVFSPKYIGKYGYFYTAKLYLKCKNLDKIKPTLKEILYTFKNDKSFKISLNLNPIDL